MAEFISSVGSGKDYSDVIAWEAGEQTSIGAGDQVVGETYGAISHNARIQWGGWTYGDSASRIIVRPADGERHTGKAGTGSSLTLSTNNTIFAGALEETHVTISAMEINDGAFAQNILISYTDNGFLVDYLFDSCVIGMNGSAVVNLATSTNAGTIIKLVRSVAYGGGTRFMHNQSGANACAQ